MHACPPMDNRQTAPRMQQPRVCRLPPCVPSLSSVCNNAPSTANACWCMRGQGRQNNYDLHRACATLGSLIHEEALFSSDADHCGTVSGRGRQATGMAGTDLGDSCATRALYADVWSLGPWQASHRETHVHQQGESTAPHRQTDRSATNMACSIVPSCPCSAWGTSFIPQAPCTRTLWDACIMIVNTSTDDLQ